MPQVVEGCDVWGEHNAPWPPLGRRRIHYGPCPERLAGVPVGTRHAGLAVHTVAAAAAGAALAGVHQVCLTFGPFRLT